MRIPVIQGVIERRILANYRVDPEVVARVLPKPFRPQLVRGFAIAGICLIRLKNVRPKLWPFPWGIHSENAAHRIAVEWDAQGQTRSGVYIPRRDSSSLLNSFAGGTLFPGEHHYATFKVQESDSHLSVNVNSYDNSTRIHVSGHVQDFVETNLFSSLTEASDFFAKGSLGYSATHDSRRFDGLELRCSTWQVEPLAIERMESSFFDDKNRFPTGSIHFDCALLMRNVQHEWHGREDICCRAEI
ncbi:MAG: DUF2071 domain-containing protein [Planctomycetes bacterium]|nr:DUF2071 domain-containing protein [Planctomycetota bacterium]